MLTKEEGIRFEQILEDFDISTNMMLGTYDFYQVIGLPRYGSYSEKNYQDRFKYLTVECQVRKDVLNLGRACITAAKLTLNNEASKKEYDLRLKKKIKNQAKVVEDYQAKENKIAELQRRIEDNTRINNRQIQDLQRIIEKLKVDIRDLEYEKNGKDRFIIKLEGDIMKKNKRFKIAISILILLVMFISFKLFYIPDHNTQIPDMSENRAAGRWLTRAMAKVYRDPNNKSEIIGELPVNSQLQAVFETNYFIKINCVYQDETPVTGYVMKSTLKRIDN